MMTRTTLSQDNRNAIPFGKYIRSPRFLSAWPGTKSAVRILSNGENWNRSSTTRASRRYPIQGSEVPFLIGSEHMKRRMHSNFGFVAAGFCAAILIQWHNAVASENARLSGYAIQNERCGEAPYAYPRVRIAMRTRYCAGLAASKEDGLPFPRSIIQVPCQYPFVIAD